MRPLKSYSYDPDALLDYSIDWSNWLSTGDTVTSSTWTVDDGVTKESETNTTTVSTVVVSGGTAGATYDLLCHIVTAEGLEDDRTIRLHCTER